MHAYLVVGKGGPAKKEAVASLAKELNAKLLDFDFGKISHVREIAKFTNLSHSERFAILLRDVDKASLEALNAFLKNLEEPQETLSYILTADSLNSVLPTIVSRCQVLKLKDVKPDKKTAGEMLSFINMDTPQKLNFLTNIKDRQDAVEFLERLILATHASFFKGKKDVKALALIARAAEETRQAVEGNGNVNLQLTSFAISLS